MDYHDLPLHWLILCKVTLTIANVLDDLSVITQLLVALIGSMFDFIPGLCIQQTAVFLSAQSLIPRKHKNPKSWQM